MDLTGVSRALEETFGLDIALDGLGMLSTVTNARQDYLNELRNRGRARSLSSSPNWSTETAPAGYTHLNGPPLKETSFRSVDSAMLYSVSGSNLNKMLQKRSRKNRISPYCRRKPSSTVMTSSCRSSSGTGSPTTSLSSDDGERGLTPITQLFQEHLNLKQNHLPHPHRSAMTNQNLQVQATSSVEAFQPESLGLKMKTDCINTTFPIPILTRSKSLEDLREFVKPKTKSLSSYVCGCGGVSSVDVSIPVRFFRGNSEVVTSTRPRHLGLAELARLSLDSQNIKTEIDSMSMRIQKLDVV